MPAPSPILAQEELKFPTSVQKTSEPIYAQEKSKDVPWWLESIDHKVNAEIRTLLETYSNIPPAEVLSHVNNIRERLWSIRTYPCTGLGAFLTPLLPHSPAYSSIITRLQHGDTLLDVGCFIGHDLRRLVKDGAPSENLYAADVANHWDVGYEMFRDRGRFSAEFVEGDIMYPNKALKRLEGKIDVISIISVLHQWGLEDQVKAIKELLKLFRQDDNILQPDSNCLAVGFQIGSLKARVTERNTFRHDPFSFTALWERVGRETGTRWECDARLREFKDVGVDGSESAYLGEDARMLQFVVNRIE